MFQGGLNVGRDGYGVVTNSGTYRYVGSPTIIGAATNGVGGIRADSYGAIRGWGIFTYADSYRKDDKNIHARLGNGKIEGDGEGVERTLDCSEIWQVTNVVFAAGRPCRVIRRADHRLRRRALFARSLLRGRGDADRHDGCGKIGLQVNGKQQ